MGLCDKLKVWPFHDGIHWTCFLAEPTAEQDLSAVVRRCTCFPTPSRYQAVHDTSDEHHLEKLHSS